jgi:UDP-GlcNAc:undecaprenyl-phosphate GlcNAc-1-phosphate transferase
LSTHAPSLPSAGILPAGDDLLPTPDREAFGSVSVMDLLNSYAPVFLGAFVVALLITPLVRKLAEAAGVVDRPDARKLHTYPVPYLGGLAVFAAIIVAVGISFVLADRISFRYEAVPIAVIIGMVAITFTGLADDIWGWDPRLKIAGQLVAAAALAIDDVGVRVAAGVLQPASVWLDPILGSQNLVFSIPTPLGEPITIDVIYWTGTAIIALFVLGGCNAANLIDGLDGLLTGVVAIVATGLFAISLFMAVTEPKGVIAGAPQLDGARIVVCMALLGAVLGFLPHNFNPASIFLGDCGSLLLGYVCVAIILMFGELGQTHLVFAGLIVFAVPIMDTALAIVRRRMAGVSMSAADNNHIHHQLNRSLGGVKRAVFALYGISFSFAIIGVTLAALVMFTQLRVRVIYCAAFVLFGFIAVIAVKAARRHQRALAAGAVAAHPLAPAPPARERAPSPASAAPRSATEHPPAPSAPSSLSRP